ncbi:MAG: DUF1667 domain-containing protein [Candidatus Izemoplasmataceae bacterium]
MKKEMICIVCPVGCHLEIDENLNVQNNRCKRGEVYAKKEVLNPTRMLTSTVRIKSRRQNRVSIKTTDNIPKNLIFDVMKTLDEVSLEAPVKLGDVIIKNVLDSGVDIVATMSINE